MLKSISLFLRKNHLLKWWGRLSPLNWIEAFTLFLLLKLPPKNWSHSMKFLSPEFALYLYKSTIRPCKEYCCHVWSGAPSCHLALLNNLQKRICRTVGLSLAVSFEPLAHRRNVASLSLLYKCYIRRCSSELVQLVPLLFFYGRFTHVVILVILHNFSVTIPRCYKDVYVNSLYLDTARLCILCL